MATTTLTLCDVCSEPVEKSEKIIIKLNTGETYNPDFCDIHEQTLLDLISNTNPRGTRSRAANTDGLDLSEVRAWGKEAGYEIGDRGRISSEIVEAYKLAIA